MKLSRVGQGLTLWMMGTLLAASTHAAEPNRVYDTNCALCHQRAGAGLAGQFPRLAGRAGEIAANEAGRRYLIETTLFGMAGKVEVDGASIVGVMPSFSLLSDDDLASVLNYIVSLDGPAQNGKGTGKSRARAKTRCRPSPRPTCRPSGPGSSSLPRRSSPIANPC